MKSTMKISFLIILLFLSGCASRVALNDGNGYAYIYTKQLERTETCSGESIEIVGIRQAGRKAVFTSVHSIYIPEGENYLYYVPVYEDKNNGECRVIEEIVVRHSDVPVSSIDRRPMGAEVSINVEAGKSYILEYSGGKVELKEYAQ